MQVHFYLFFTFFAHICDFANPDIAKSVSHPQIFPYRFAYTSKQID